MNYWLLKSEPGNYSITDLRRDGSTAWTGVRNFKARNFMWKEMRVGDVGIFYHSNAEPSGCYGLLKIKEAAHADDTQFDSKSKYFEPRATEAKPVWFCVDVGFVEEFKKAVSLADLRANPKLKKMEVLKKGNRLSVLPLKKEELGEVLKMAGAKFKI